MLTEERVCGLRVHVEVSGGERRKKSMAHTYVQSQYTIRITKKNSIISMSDIIRH